MITATISAATMTPYDFENTFGIDGDDFQLFRNASNDIQVQ